MTRELIDAQEDAAGFINGIKWRGTVNASRPAICNLPRMYRRYFWELI